MSPHTSGTMPLPEDHVMNQRRSRRREGRESTVSLQAEMDPQNGTEGTYLGMDSQKIVALLGYTLESKATENDYKVVPSDKNRQVALQSCLRRMNGILKWDTLS